MATIPLTNRVPIFSVEINAALGGNNGGILKYDVLLFGQMIAPVQGVVNPNVGTATPNQLREVFPGDNFHALYGAGSSMALMLIRFFRENTISSAWVYPLEDQAGSTASSKSITLTGAHTNAGTLVYDIYGKRIVVPVAAGDTLTQITTAIAEVINADKFLPFIAVAGNAEVTISTKAKGQFTRTFNVSESRSVFDVGVDGIVSTIAVVNEGTINPLLTDMIAKLSSKWFQIIGNPYTDSTSIDVMDVELERRFGNTVQFTGHSIMAAKDELLMNGTPLSVIQKANGKNYRTASMFDVTGLTDSVEELSAQIAGLVSREVQMDPGKPLKDVELIGVKAIPDEDTKSYDQKNVLLNSGVSTLKSVAGKVFLERSITMYRLDSQGAVDTSYLDLNRLAILAFIRWDFITYFARETSRSRLVGSLEGRPSGRTYITPDLARSMAISRFIYWMNDLVLVENLDQFIADLSVTIDPLDANRLNFDISPNIVNQLITGGASLLFVE